MANATLPQTHYAASWPVDQLNIPEQITDLGVRFFSLPEGQEKEQLLLELLRSFHGYTVKYLHMILRGHLPAYAGDINADAKIFLQMFLPKGTPANRETLLRACRTLHLAFQGNATIDGKSFKSKQFTAGELNLELGSDGPGTGRVRSRRGLSERPFRGLSRTQAARPKRRPSTPMTKFASTLSCHLQDTLGLFQPLIETMRAGDQTALFMDVAPGLAQAVHGRVREAVLRLVRAGWVAGRRGRVTRILLDALGQLQRGRTVDTADQALQHLGAALGHLRRAAAAVARISPPGLSVRG